MSRILAVRTIPFPKHSMFPYTTPSQQSVIELDDTWTPAFHGLLKDPIAYKMVS
jgi:hypothetical protein